LIERKREFADCVTCQNKDLPVWNWSLLFSDPSMCLEKDNRDKFIFSFIGVAILWKCHIVDWPVWHKVSFIVTEPNDTQRVIFKIVIEIPYSSFRISSREVNWSCFLFWGERAVGARMSNHG
jgi:hypothetical protein